MGKVEISKSARDSTRSLRKSLLGGQCVAVFLKPLSSDRFASNESNADNGNTAGSLNTAFELFEMMKEANRRIVKGSKLYESLSELRIVGWIRLNTLLLSGPHEDVRILRHFWTKRLVKSPVGYFIKDLALVKDFIVESVPQSQFMSLTTALFDAIADLNQQGLFPGTDIILDYLRKHYPDLQTPDSRVVNECLGRLVRDKKVFHNGRGYFILYNENILNDMVKSQERASAKTSESSSLLGAFECSSTLTSSSPGQTDVHTDLESEIKPYSQYTAQDIETQTEVTSSAWDSAGSTPRAVKKFFMRHAKLDKINEDKAKKAKLLLCGMTGSITNSIVDLKNSPVHHYKPIDNVVPVQQDKPVDSCPVQQHKSAESCHVQQCRPVDRHPTQLDLSTRDLDNNRESSSKLTPCIGKHNSLLSPVNSRSLKSSIGKPSVYQCTNENDSKLLAYRCTSEVKSDLAQLQRSTLSGDSDSQDTVCETNVKTDDCVEVTDASPRSKPKRSKSFGGRDMKRNGKEVSFALVGSPMDQMSGRSNFQRSRSFGVGHLRRGRLTDNEHENKDPHVLQTFPLSSSSKYSDVRNSFIDDSLPEMSAFYYANGLASLKKNTDSGRYTDGVDPNVNEAAGKDVSSGMSSPEKSSVNTASLASSLGLSYNYATDAEEDHVCISSGKGNVRSVLMVNHNNNTVTDTLPATDRSEVCLDESEQIAEVLKSPKHFRNTGSPYDSHHRTSESLSEEVPSSAPSEQGVKLRPKALKTPEEKRRNQRERNSKLFEEKRASLTIIGRV